MSEASTSRHNGKSQLPEPNPAVSPRGPTQPRPGRSDRIRALGDGRFQPARLHGDVLRKKTRERDAAAAIHAAIARLGKPFFGACTAARRRSEQPQIRRGAGKRGPGETV